MASTTNDNTESCNEEVVAVAAVVVVCGIERNAQQNVIGIVLLLILTNKMTARRRQ